MTDKHPTTPRIFISYSWTSEEHTEWVGDLGERLMNDGIDVVLDQWALEDGHDVNAFMEKMVTDPTIKRVIIVSDALYAAKADGRKGGVGTETQIISKEVYDSVDQNKFVPLVRERDETGVACLPVYLKSRKYIDFSDSDNEADAYDQLVRNIFERPRRRKPALGSAPSHLFDDEATVVTSAQKAKRFREFVSSGRGNPSAALEDFAEEFLKNIEELRLTYSNDHKDEWCQMMFDNIESAKVHRDVFIDVVKTATMHVREEWFMPGLVSLLERLLAFQFRPQKSGSFFDCSEDNYKFLNYEFFLYTLSAFIKARRYDDGRALLDHHFVAPDDSMDSQKLGTFMFSQFNIHAKSLEGDCSDRGNTRRLSVMADLIRGRASRSDIRFTDLLQADVICCIVASRVDGYYGWHPRCLVYASNLGKLELFARATNEAGYEPLKTLLQFNTPEEMLKYISSEKMTRIWHAEKFLRSLYAANLFNLDVLCQIWDVPDARNL